MSLGGPEGQERRDDGQKAEAKSDPAKEPAVPPSAPEDTFGDAMRRIGDAAMDAGEHLYAATERGMERLATNVKLGAAQVAEFGGRVAENVSVGISRAGAATKRWTGSTATHLLEFLGSEPNLDPTFTQKLMQQAPVIGALKSYADDWKTYHAGKNSEDSAMMEKAMRGCLNTFVQVGIDIAVLGGSKLTTADAIVKKVGFGLTLTRLVGTVASKLNIDLTAKLVDGVLQSEQAKRIVGGFFEMVTPSEGQKPPVGEQ